MDRLVSDIAERLDMPPEALGEPKLTVIGHSRLLIENHRGLLEYGSEHICVAVRRGRINIEGCGLSVSAMNKCELIINGKIQSLELS